MKITMENIRVMRYAELINQRKIARLLASLVNCGLKILITTHSDYVLREFNHLILLTGKSPHLKKIVKEKGYKDLELLPSSKRYGFIQQKKDVYYCQIINERQR